MGKRWKKQKAGTQKSKRRKPKPQPGTSAEGAGGTMGGFRKGLQAITGTGKKKKKGPKSPVEKVFDIVLWIAVIAALGYFISNQCM